MSAKRRSLSRLLLAGLTLGSVAVLAALGLSASAGHNGRPAPGLPSERLSGEPVTLPSLRGRPAVVVFWASWCTPCEQEAPALERFARELSARGGGGGGGGGVRATLVGVNWSDPSAANARAFVRRFGWTFPNLRDGDDAVGERYGVKTLPTTFAIDARGRIRDTLNGPQTQATLRHALALAGG